MAPTFSLHTIGFDGFLSIVIHISLKRIIAVFKVLDFNGEWLGIGVFGQHRQGNAAMVEGKAFCSNTLILHITI